MSYAGGSSECHRHRHAALLSATTRHGRSQELTRTASRHHGGLRRRHHTCLRSYAIITTYASLYMLAQHVVATVIVENRWLLVGRRRRRRYRLRRRDMLAEYYYHVEDWRITSPYGMNNTTVGGYYLTLSRRRDANIVNIGYDNVIEASEEWTLFTSGHRHVVAMTTWRWRLNECHYYDATPVTTRRRAMIRHC